MFLFTESQKKESTGFEVEIITIADSESDDVGRTLPWWCVIIAWTLVALSTAGAAFFTILYSLQWGQEKSTAWLTTFLLSFFQSVVLIQPLKVKVGDDIKIKTSHLDREVLADEYNGWLNGNNIPCGSNNCKLQFINNLYLKCINKIVILEKYTLL